MTATGVLTYGLHLPFILQRNFFDRHFVNNIFVLLVKENTILYYHIPDNGWFEIPNNLVVTTF